MWIENEKTLIAEAKIQDFIDTSDLSIEEIEIAIKNIKQKQNKTQDALKVVLELNKDDIIHLVMWVTCPSYDFITELGKKWYGYYTWGMEDSRTRNDFWLKKASIEDLLELYKKIKK